MPSDCYDRDRELRVTSCIFAQISHVEWPTFEMHIYRVGVKSY